MQDTNGVADDLSNIGMLLLKIGLKAGNPRGRKLFPETVNSRVDPSSPMMRASSDNPVSRALSFGWSGQVLGHTGLRSHSYYRIILRNKTSNYFQYEEVHILNLYLV